MKIQSQYVSGMWTTYQIRNKQIQFMLSVQAD